MNEILRFIYRNSISEYSSIMPETALGVGISSSVLGCTSISTAIFNSDKNVKKDATALGIISMLPASMFLGATAIYSLDLADTEAYIQSLSKEQLQELSNNLSLMSENEEGIIEEFQNKTISDFGKTYNEMEDEIIQKTKKHSIWDR